MKEYIVWERIRTAKRLGIPAGPDKDYRVWIDRGDTNRLFSIGYTQGTPRLAKTIAGDKSLSFSYMQRYGLPLPLQKIAYDKKSVVKAANEIGYPVVIKPRWGNKGEAVHVNLKGPAREGKANTELVKRLAKHLGLSTADIALVAGHKSRDKTLVVSSMKPEEVLARLSNVV